MRTSIVRVSGAALAVVLAAAPRAPRAEAGPCQDGISALERGDPVAAHALLEDCEGAEARRARKGARMELESGDYAPVSISVPEGATVEISALPGARFRGSIVLWLPFGEHELEVSAKGRVPHRETIEVEDRSRFSVLVELEEKPSGEATTQDVDFGEEGNGAAVGESISAIDPRPKKHESIMPIRFRRGPDPAPPGEQRERKTALHLPLYVAGGLALAAGAAVHIAGGGTARYRYTAYGLYGLGAAGLGLGAFFHWRY